jgi:hypothetical protein
LLKGESEANAERIRNIEKCFGNDTNNVGLFTDKIKSRDLINFLRRNFRDC